ncbi:MAG: hypothetical protein IPH45_08190 [Bacteroidales bacterium]|nr:hypothetical protein [Bacteroidales bacterium]
MTINSPLFIKNKKSELQIGAKINNYGLYYNFAGQLKRKILIFSIQHNSGNIKFDPFNFNKYFEPGQATHLIQSYPSKMFYCELGLGYDINLKKQKLSILFGIGQQFQKNNTRYFFQVDWGNETRLLNAGVSLRGNYSLVNNTRFATLEPAVQGKLKIWKLRIVTQLGYSIALKKGHDYAKPILSMGLDFIL